jgi:cyclophilin family peptidyl-prolyl cis-trans isomerase
MRDMTTGKTVFLAKAVNPPSGVGLTHVDEFSSANGVPIDHEHKYSLISTYDNPTNANADSMASVFLGMDDPEITVPTSEDLAHTSAALFDSKILVLHTNIGVITATLDRERAPETVIQVARFALGGAFDATQLIGQMNNVKVTLPSQKVGPLLQPVRPEAGVVRQLGTVSYCRAGGNTLEPSIVIDTGDMRQFNRQCTGFARIAKGIDLLAAFQPGTSASLVKAETVGAAVEAKKVAAK